MDVRFGIPASPALSISVESHLMFQNCHTEPLALNLGVLANLAANLGDL
jgi:hypothetical protein